MRGSLSHAWLLAAAVLVLAEFAATVSSALATSASSTAKASQSRRRSLPTPSRRDRPSR